MVFRLDGKRENGVWMVKVCMGNDWGGCKLELWLRCELFG